MPEQQPGPSVTDRTAQTDDGDDTGGFSRTAVRVLVCGVAMLILAMGLRQSFGIFQTPISMDLGTGRQVFGLAIAGMIQTTPYPVSPEPGAIVNSRLPEISADLSTVPDLDPETLVMKVAGFGEVPANYASGSGKFSWQVNRRLRHKTCQVLVTWKDSAGKDIDNPLRWSFSIDRAAAYLPDGE